MLSSLGFASNKKGRRKKLNPKADKYIYVGYSDTSKAYRLLDLNLREVKKRVSVKFDETMNYKQHMESQTEEISPALSGIEVESESNSNSDKGDKVDWPKVEVKLTIDKPT